MEKETDEFITELYRELYTKLLIYASSALGDKSRAMAEQAVQETFLIACRKSTQLTESPNPRGWLFNTLKYVIKNMRRENSEMILYLEELKPLEEKGEEECLSPDTLYNDISLGED
ncbi:MAG: hypothetical protein GX061_02475 [Eubacteriaceae bacterium]|nr:hypothetical protein [Eubacteriaceae bacterium]